MNRPAVIYLMVSPSRSGRCAASSIRLCRPTEVIGAAARTREKPERMDVLRSRQDRREAVAVADLDRRRDTAGQLAAWHELGRVALQGADKRGRLQILRARSGALGCPQDRMRPLSIRDDSRRQLLGVVGTNERHRDRSHRSADPSFIALPSGDVDRCRALGPDDLGDDAYAGSAALEAVVDVARVTLECVLRT